MSSSSTRARICARVVFSSSGNLSSARSFWLRNATSLCGRLGMGTFSVGFFAMKEERTRYFPKLFKAAKCSQMLAGARRCFIFKSQTKLFTESSVKLSRGAFSGNACLNFSRDFL